MTECLNKEITEYVEYEYNKAKEGYKKSVSISLPKRLKDEFFMNFDLYEKHITETYPDVTIKTSELGKDWYNGWNLSRQRQATNHDVPDELIGATNKYYNKRGSTTALNFKVSLVFATA